MILVDTSIWADHFRRRSAGLALLLYDRSVLCHPLVIGELALGNLSPRAQTLEELAALPCADEETHEGVLALIGDANLFGSGIGLIDAHLIASAIKSDCLIWTADKRLAAVAARLDVGYAPEAS